MLILVDIGNTLSKIAINRGKIDVNEVVYKSIPTKSEDYYQTISKVLEMVQEKVIANKTNVKGAIISCVVPSKLLATVALIKKITGLTNKKIIIVDIDIISKQTLLKVQINNHQIGSDLLCLAFAVSYYYNGNGIVVALGTATTYTIVKDYQLIGVIIGPGFTNSKEAIIINAAQIQPFNISYIDSYLGKNTSESLSIGYGHGFKFMIEGTLKAIFQEVKAELPIIFAGGAFSELKPFLNFSFKTRYNWDTLLIGMAAIYYNVTKKAKK